MGDPGTCCLLFVIKLYTCVVLCSYPILEVQSIPNTTAVVYNWLCLAVAVLVIELLLFRKQHSLTVGIAGEEA
jgi:hypothetical protein